MSTTVIDFGSVNGSLTALGLFASLFAVLGWAVARAIRRRSHHSRRMPARAIGLALFAGLLVLVYSTSLDGFYEVRVTDTTVRARYLIPGFTRDIPRSKIQDAVAVPSYRGRWRLTLHTKDGTSFESATDGRDVVELAQAHLQRRFRGDVDASATTPATPSGLPGVDVVYTANEGLLISAGEQRVLIDGLFRPYETYARLPQADREVMETARPPFDGIDVVLVSHVHGDHFHPEAVSRHLVSNPGARLVSSEQATAEVQRVLPAAAAPRVTAVTVPVGERRRLAIDGFDIEALGLRHGGSRFRALQNLGHLIRMGGRTMLHVGDADATPENFRPLKLDQERIDIAFLPGWFMLDSTGRLVIDELIRPRQVVAVHLLEGETEILRQIRGLFPSADGFTALLERRKY